MNTLPRKALLLLVSISVSSTLVAGDGSPARAWLDRMSSAMSQMSYQGTFVYVRDGVVETMRITHVADESGVRERLFSISGPRREVIRDQDGVRCVLEDSAAAVEAPMVVNSFFPELPMSVIDGENSGYRLELGGQARIAGQLARRVSILPLDGYRYGYDFWLEEQTGLLLKWALFGAKHKLLAKLMFTDFVMGEAVDLAELESDAAPEDFVELKTFKPQTAQLAQAGPRWQPKNLPPGFLLESHSKTSGAHGQSEHLVYSDGLAAVSVYVEPSGSAQSPAQGSSHIGTNNAYSRQAGGLQITVIGEVPALTVKTIAQGMATAVAAN